ncbi:T9SS type B sorting domain-containing protein [Kaistella flava (ex Peng et al. 2021)]|uniref:T9SS type B sorting domain-containing protein n=1 Tax=Kaistella flava (ex Peng et al. 2021) TaxID=2038776 RepID=A0A7M2Y7F6_9FLAO|nr:T9SS type B sorting domain-containing protein [Kaistella flava (ex Peng et al. 2021)]QOW09604.1 T9SS type B sorting domain-containing protein [Kaistella flava (ex Peng et al. 2021)]
MKQTLLFLFLFSFSTTLFSQKSKNNSNAFFYENKGQIVDQDGKENSKVKYLLNIGGLNVQLKNEGFSYDVYDVRKTLIKRKKRKEDNLSVKDKQRPEYDLKFQFHRVDINFVGANRNSQIIAEGKSEDYDNYYNLPNKPEGVENVHRFEKVTYKNLYSNIDLVFFKPKDTLKPVEYNFIVNPGGKISDIQLKFSGAKTKLKDGKLSMNLRFGEMQENIPHSWEEEGIAKNTISVQFKDLGNQTFGFASEKNISDKVVVIDPVPTRIWGSYFGGNGEDYGFIKADKNNNIYVFGTTGSVNNIATTGSYQSNLAGGRDAFISKISKDGQRFWGTYYGKPYFDITGSVDFDDQFNVYTAIVSQKPNPRYPGNYYYWHQKLVLLKLNPNGILIFNKEIGSETGNPSYNAYGDETEINDVKVFNNKVYFTGYTRIDGFGTPGTFQANLNSGQSGFLSKFDAVTGDLDYFTYIGGIGSTSFYTIFNADSTGIEILGTTSTLNFPMVDAFQVLNNQGSNGSNGLYVKFSEAGNLVKSSYIGANEYYYFLSAQRFGDEVMFGARMQTKNKFCYYLVDTSLKIIKDYKEVTVFNNDGDIYIDRQRNIFTSGRASPNDSWVNQVTTSGAYMPKIGQYISAFFTKYDSNFQKIWSTFYQGDGGTQIGMIIKDYADNLYFSGMSSNNKTGIATPGTFQQVGGHPSNDIFIAKFADCASNVTVSFVPTCINQNLQLNASGGTSYEWFGPNGFTSTLQNPIRVNAQASDSGEYFVRITGGQSCGGIFSVIVNIGSPTLPNLDIPNLPNITAFCKITVTAIPTATTGCGTKINATTTDPLSYNTPGNYIIHWNYDDGNGHTLNQNQNVIVQGVALPTANATQNFCLIDAPKISDIIIYGTDIQWYDVNNNLLNPNTILVNGKEYFATQTLSACESAKQKVLVNVNNPNPPTGNATQDFCSAQNPTISNIILIEQNVKWYDGIGTLLPLTTPLVDGKTYYATQTVNGCESTQKIAVKVIVTNGGIPAKDFPWSFCNDTIGNTKTDNLNNYKGNLITNPTNYIFEFFDANNQVIPNPANVDLNYGSNLFNVKISNSLGCFNFVKLNLTLNPKPILNLRLNEEFCNGQTAKLDAGSGFDSYEWTKDNSPTVISKKQILIVSEAGKYSIKVKNSFCENTASVTVTQSIIATIVGIQIVNNTATVQMSNSGDFEYSLDNLKWQDSNVFKNLSNGNFTVFVKTKLGCIIGSMNLTIFSIPNAFSPDADGINDTWKIDGIENYPNSEIQVFDRFGTLVLQKITNGTFEWDGFSNSRVLPTGNYWYVIKVSDGRLLNGWVLIKNRN